MPDWREIEPYHTALEHSRALEETLWLELGRMLEEDGGDNLNIRPDTSRRRTDTYDSTPLYAKDDFVGGLFTEAMNPADRFFKFTLEDTELAKWGPVASWLWAAADITFGTLDPSTSNFYLEATPWLGDMAAFGPGFLQQDEKPTGGFIDRALPLRECYKSVDGDGDMDRFHRAFYLNDRQAKQKFGDAAPSMTDGEQAKFVQAIYPNPDYRPGRLDVRGKPWLSCYASPDKQKFFVEKGYFELPVHEIAWRRRSGRPWPTGVGHKALADMNMLDEMQRSVITALQFEAEPMWLVHDEDVMTAADIQPNAVIAGGMTSNGKKNVEIAERGENLHFPLAAVENVRTQIREAFKFSLMQVINRPQMTAAEFTGWKEEKLRVMAPHLVCIHRGLGGFVSRRAAILQRNGRLPPPPPELQNQRIKIGFVSPFDQAQKAAKARNALQVGNAALTMQPLFPTIGDNINGDNLIRIVSDGLSGDPSLIFDPRDVAQTRQQRAQQTAPDIQLARGAQQAAIVADVAHAAQATTLAKTRGKAA